MPLFSRDQIGRNIFFQFNQIKFQLNTNLTIQYFLIFFQYFLLFQNQKISFLSNRCSMSESKKYCKLYHNLILSIFPISNLIDAANQVPVSKRSNYLELRKNAVLSKYLKFFLISVIKVKRYYIFIYKWFLLMWCESLFLGFSKEDFVGLGYTYNLSLIYIKGV